MPSSHLALLAKVPLRGQRRPLLAPLGAVLGEDKYRLNDFIAQGGVASVYGASHIFTKEGEKANQFAIKLIDTGVETFSDRAVLLRREAEILRRLTHPRIVPLVEYGEDAVYGAYCVMPQLAGETLADLLRRRGAAGFPKNLAFNIILSLARALSFVHENGFVHSDIKTGNVFVSPAGEVVLFDFGAARPLFLRQSTTEKAADLLTEAHSMVSPGYASPERLMGAVPEKRDDVFALAIIAYILLAGQHPFAGQTSLEAWEKGQDVPAVLGLTASQTRVIKQALSWQAASGLDDVDVFVEAFEQKSLFSYFRKKKAG